METKDNGGAQLTIIVPVYNRASLIGRCLDSIHLQTLRPLDVIVVDNGSSDNTLRSVKEWCRGKNLCRVEKGKREESDGGAEVRGKQEVSGGEAAEDGGVWERDGFRLTLTVEKKRGASAARNRGLEMVVTPYVNFFDSDDRMLPALASTAVESLGKADLVLWKAKVMSSDDPGDGAGVVKKYRRRSLLRNQMIHSIVSTQTFAARTEWIRACGGWNEEALAWNDWEIGLRLLAAPRIVFVPEVLALVYPQRESITGTGFLSKAGVWESTLDIVEERLRGEKDTPSRREMLRLIPYRRMILAAHYAAEGRPDIGRDWLEKALQSPEIGGAGRLWLRILYAWTARGGRGASILWR